MKPTLILAGADKGGVGKTTTARALIDYLIGKGVSVRAFDTENPRGTLHRFHPQVTEIIDIGDVADQMKILDDIETAPQVTVVDLKAGSLSSTLDTFERIGVLETARNGQFDMGLFHVVGPSMASLEEMNEVAGYVEGLYYVVARNFINETNFFEWDEKTFKKYFAGLSNAREIEIPKLNEMAYEQVDLAGTTFTDFIDNRDANGNSGKFSFVLRGYVRKWASDMDSEFGRLELIKHILDAGSPSPSGPNVSRNGRNGSPSRKA